jgi:4-aminobutyrate aminotransferase-like enzyme
MEYFNTFGGNPLSCKIGNAVLDVIEEEALQENAKEVGEFLLSGLRELQKKNPSFGDARGLGLYLGLVCVKEGRGKEPNPALASGIVEAMRERGVLLSVDGPLHDVIKIKPPLVFQKNDAKFLLHCLDSTMREIQ